MNNDAKKTKVFKLMIGVFIALLVVGYGWTRYGDSSKADNSNTNNVSSIESADDAEQLKSLVVRLYKWKDKVLTDGDFIPVADEKNYQYTGIDIDKHNSRLSVLRMSGFFTEDFLIGYDDITKTIDKTLKSKKVVWLVGDLSPFNTGVNPWCNCQDYPKDNPWDDILITIDFIDSRNASLTWMWNSTSQNFAYNITAEKVDNTWKIMCMQGFDDMRNLLE